MIKKYNLINDKIDLNFSWIKKKDFQKTLDYLRAKEEKYLLITIESLSDIHKIELSEIFWRKVLGPGFRRFVHITYEAFKQHENNLKSGFIIDKVDKNQYKTPLDFEEFRNYFTNSECGYNQLLSQYVDSMNKKVIIDKMYLSENQVLDKFNKLDILLRKLKNITLWKSINLFLKFIFMYKEPKLIIIGSYFKPSYLTKLLFKSSGNIKNINLEVNNKDNCFNKRLRNMFLRKFNKIDDKFDKFFYHAIYYNFPSFFIENFHSHYIFYSNHLDKYKKLKYIVSENWITNTHNSFLLALAKENRDIKHIYNEHNTLFHHVLGGSVDLEISLVDIYYTIGWNRQDVTKGASLYDYSISQKYIEKYEILYISSATFIRRSEWNSAYAQSQECAHLHISFVYDFFNKLKKEKINKIVYRAYPVQSTWKSFKKEIYLKTFLDEFLLIDDYRDSSKIMMKKSSLVIVDYFATSFLEALIMNIPVIIFWNKKTYFLNDKYNDFFDVLIECGICQTSSESAASFINNLHDVKLWWCSELVQNARKTFLNVNIANPNDAIEFYLSLVNK